MREQAMFRKLLLCGFLLSICQQGFSQILLNNFESVDLTLVSGATGVDVVDATLLKIDSISGEDVTIENDFGFLRRIALVESNFGNATLEYENGGIWQISPYIESFLFDIPAAVQSLVNLLGQTFGNNTIDFANSDFSIPLHSAVAARVFIEIQLSTNNEDFPGSVDEQAAWWAATYRNMTGSTTIFVIAVQDFEGANQCNVSRMDLWFLIDGSGSIGIDPFQTCLTFVDQTALQFEIDPDKVRTGLMIYSSSTILRSYFNQNQTNQEFSNVVLSTSYPGGGTYTGAAIDQVARVGFNESNGARPRTDGVPRVLVVLTDGKSGDSVVEASANIKAEGVTVFGVGVGSGFNEAEVNEIASEPDATYSYALSEFSDLASVLQGAIADQACSVSAVIPEGTNVSFVYEPGSVSYSQLDIPVNGSLELVFNVRSTTSIGICYTSVSVPNPGPALHDAMFEVSVGVTVAYFNVEPNSPSGQRRRKRQVDSGIQPSTLYIGFETRGSEPINIEFTATERAEAFVAPTTTTLSPTTSGVETTSGIGAVPLMLLNFLVLWLGLFV